jgi:hypothetical protein
MTIDRGRLVRPHDGLLAALLLFIALGVRAQTQTGQIRGTVIDEDGKALQGVKVEARSASHGRQTALTNKNGQFRFPSLAPGRYKVTFTLESFADIQKDANVHLESTVTVDAKMFRLSG